jgi:hypothetical protein
MATVTIGGKTVRARGLECPVCDGDLTHANEYGMFCDNECELEEAKDAKADFDKVFGTLFGIVKSFRQK